MTPSCAATLPLFPAGLASSLPLPGRQSVRKPDGGFALLSVDTLLVPWWLYKQEVLAFFDLRVWLGTLEMAARRRPCASGTPAHYHVDELCHLLHEPRAAPVAATLRHLEATGLLTWSPQALGFTPHPEVLQQVDARGYHALRTRLPPQQRRVPVPRRLLRWLAQESCPGLLATACGVVLRCLRYTRGRCIANGRVAAPWIATGLGIAERTVQRALHTLHQVGWLRRPTTRRQRERPHGRVTHINLTWAELPIGPLDFPS